ncbi:RNA polymerase factor sigma-54 [Cohnella pontilimi]|uniref:RNA polymerase factor sigma-54 n=1 Tax=Cohnella pontilimi TaxID=2564100 RepID=A0A4U0FA05_9BACL|nr:RNA polymerase factor sigma-54 [Cohnella pontilimi]TJY41555.1 RNA polymerase factor sigma-54 [Cohnella pontilimi]
MRPSLSISQQLKLNVKLMLKPELQQSLHMLQLSGYELIRFLNEQADRNPVLDLELPQLSGGRERRKGFSLQASRGNSDPFWSARAFEDTLEQDLLSQLRIAGMPEGLYRIAAFLAGNLDESGYLAVSSAEAALLLGEPEEKVLEALRCIQSMEPAGIGARNLQECLQLQIERDPSAEARAYEAVQHCLSLIARGKWEQIARQIGVSAEEAKRISAYIRGLNPRPCAALGGEVPGYVVPDAYLTLEDGKPVVRLNPSSVPKISINPLYSGMVFSGASADTVTYLKDQVKSAMSLVHALRQRQVTLFRVIAAIFEVQDSYLTHGEKALKPLTLIAVADKLQIHESTVSRAVQHKFVRTPYGLRELKFFFSSGLSTDSGEYASATQIKIRIKELIAQENKNRPLSDQNIAGLLSREGFCISRRTVAKYREELNFLSSALRKSIL